MLAHILLVKSRFRQGSAPASARNPDGLSAILERAEKGTLRASPILQRARSDSLINVKDIQNCKQLTSLIEADEEVLYDMLPAARAYINSKASDNQDMQSQTMIREMLADTKIVRQRISRQLDDLADERSKLQCP